MAVERHSVYYDQSRKLVQEEYWAETPGVGTDLITFNTAFTARGNGTS
jgi:hypothetical protein